MTKILIPNFGSIDADTLSELLANIIKAVDDVETARNLLAAQDDACRHLADRCTQLRDLLRKK